MRTQREFSKLYFPGLISLGILPLICIFYLFGNGKFVQLYETHLVWESEKNMNKNAVYTGFTPLDLYRMREFKEVKLNGNSFSNKITINEIDKSVRELISRKDTINGFKINFTNSTTYGDFVDVYNVCLNFEDTVNFRYKLLGDNCYIFYHIPPKVRTPLRMVVCGGLVTDYRPVNADISLWQMIESELSDIKYEATNATSMPALFYLVLAIYVVLFGLSVLNLKRRFFPNT